MPSPYERCTHSIWEPCRGQLFHAEPPFGDEFCASSARYRVASGAPEEHRISGDPALPQFFHARSGDVGANCVNARTSINWLTEMAYLPPDRRWIWG